MEILGIPSRNQLNIGKFSCTSSYGLGEFNFSAGMDDVMVDFQIGVNKIGFATTQTNKGVSYYNQYYIRTIPFAFAVVCVGAVIVFAPESLPFIGLAFI